MAGANFQSIQNRVTARLKDLPANTLAEVPRMVNQAIRDLQKKHNFVVMEQVLVPVTTVGQRILTAVPSTWKEARAQNPWYIDFTGNPVKMFWRPTLEAVLSQYAYNDTTEIGDPHVILPVPVDTGGNDPNAGPGVDLFVWPFPDGQSNYTGTQTLPLPNGSGSTITPAAGEYPVFVPFWGYVSDLVNNADVNWFTDNAEDYIVFKAAAEGFYMNWDEQRGQLWEGRAGQKQKEVINLDKRRRSASTTTLQVFRDALGASKRFYDGFTQVPGQ